MPQQEIIRFSPLEGARGILAWWVVYGHMLMRSDLNAEDLSWPLTVVRLPNLAVDVFIILSGFVITHLVLTKREPYRQFIVRRFFRIYPIYVFALASVLVLEWLLPGEIFRIDWLRLWQHIAAHLVLIHGAVPNEILPASSRAILSPAWSISLEWQFYLVAPFVISAILAGRLWLLAALALTAAIVSGHSIVFFGGELSFGPHGAFLLTQAHLFLFGIGSYLLLPHIPQLAPASVGMVVIGVFMLTTSYPVAIWLFFFSSLRCEPIGKMLSWAPLVTLGTLSYSTYLLHMLVMDGLGLRFLYPWAGGREALGWEYFSVLFVFVSPVVLAVSYLGYRFIELPFIPFGQRIAPRKGARVEQAKSRYSP